jgi:uncharacterized protein
MQEYLLLFFLGLCGGFVSGLFGIGGGIVLTPMLSLVGLPLAEASAVSSLQVVFSAITNIFARRKEKAIDYKLGTIIASFGIFGSLLGLSALSLFKKYNSADVFVSIMFVCVMSWLSFVNLKHKEDKSDKVDVVSLRKITIFASFAGVFAGFLVPIMGVGGGFIIVPFLLHYAKFSKNRAVCTSIFQMLITSGFASILSIFVFKTVNVKIAFFVILGAVCSVGLGGRLSKKMPEARFKKLLGLLMLTVAIYFAIKLIVN